MSPYAVGAPRDRAGPSSSTRPHLIYLVLVGVIVVSAVLTAVEGRNFFSQGNIWAVLTAYERARPGSRSARPSSSSSAAWTCWVPYVVSLATVIAGRRE